MPSPPPRSPSPAAEPAAAKYIGIADELRDRIRRGVMAPGERLASQKELAAEFDVTVMTLRQALARLTDEGLIVARHGAGTFVADRPLHYRLQNLRGFAQDMADQGETVTTEVRSWTTEPAPAAVAQELQVGADEPVVVVQRVRRIAHRPVLFQTSYLPAAAAAVVRRRDLATTSLYEMLGRHPRWQVARAREILRAVTLDDAVAKALERPAGSAALWSQRTSLAAGDKPVLVDLAYLPGDTTQVTAERVAEGMELTYRLI